MYIHVLATGIGERKRDGVETLLTGEAQLHGFGRGEIAAGMSNLRSISNIVAISISVAAIIITTIVITTANTRGGEEAATLRRVCHAHLGGASPLLLFGWG